MSSAAVRSAFETAFATVFPTLPLVGIENITVEFPRDGAGVPINFAATLYFGSEQPIALNGDDTQQHQWRETGTINVLLYYRAGRGITDANTMADAVRNAFGGTNLPVADPGMRLALLSANPMTQYLQAPGAPIGPYFISAVSIGYEFDFLR